MKPSKLINKLKIFRSIGLSLLFILWSGSKVHAQLEGVEEGDRVRISAPTVEAKKIKGTVSSFSSEMITISFRDTTLSILNSAIRELQISTGKKRNTGKGAIIGAISGSVILGTVAFLTNEPCEEGEWCFIEWSDREALGYGALLGALGGGLNGAIIGTFIKTDRWKEVPIDVSMGFIPPGRTHSKSIPSISLKYTF